jgi:hypothetical protein
LPLKELIDAKVYGVRLDYTFNVENPLRQDSNFVTGYSRATSPNIPHCPGKLISTNALPIRTTSPTPKSRKLFRLRICYMSSAVG